MNVLVTKIGKQYPDISVCVRGKRVSSTLVFSACLGEVFEDSLSVDEFLGHESGSGNHGNTSVLEFLGLHKSEFLLVFGLEVERVETDVSRKVSITEKTGLVDRDILGFDPSDGGALLFASTDSDDKGQPERNRNLRQVGDGRSGDRGIEEEGASLNGFSGEETNSGEHCDSKD